ncbi:MAG: class 1 fructose-bisphosphatase, partial [Vulcanimicrobiaceae bacterium]
MPHRRTTFSKFIIEDQRRRPNPDPELTGLLNDIQTACKFIASAVSRGALEAVTHLATGAVANEIMLRECEWGGKLCGMVSAQIKLPYSIPPAFPRGRYLLAFDPLEGSSNLDVDVAVGSIFAVLRAADGISDPTAGEFLQAGTQQVAAGFALYGPTSMIVITLGAGVHGFTLDREIGAYTLTHADMQIPEQFHEVAIDGSNERFWEPPVRHYVDE